VTDEHKRELSARWDAIHVELADLENLRVQPAGDLAAREHALLGELESIEYELGTEYLNERRRERGKKGQ